MGKNIMLGLVVVAGFVVTILAFTIYGGYVFSWLWLWFAVPLGLPPISIAEAIGVCLLIRTPKSSTKSDKEFHETLLDAVLLNTLIWGVGYIVHLFL